MKSSYMSTLKNYADVQNFLNTLITAEQLSDTKNQSPHGAFWNDLSYAEFTTGNVPHVHDPVSGNPMPILIINNAMGSNIVMAFLGTPGSVFDPNTGAFGQMPADGPPLYNEQQIQPLIDWINSGCPNP